jgi:hypothetical protein
MEIADHDTDRRGGDAVGLRDGPSVKASPP